MKYKERKIKIGKFDYKYLDTEVGDKVVILIHGFVDSAKNVAYSMEQINIGNQHRIILVNLPGHDGLPWQGVDNIDKFARYIRKLIQYLDIGKYSLFGISVGGLIVLDYIKKYKDKDLEKAVIWASPILGYRELTWIVKLLMNISIYSPKLLVYMLRSILVYGSGLVAKITMGIRIKIDECHIRKFDSSDIRKMEKVLKEYKLSALTKNDSMYGSKNVLWVYGSKDLFITENNYKKIKSMDFFGNVHRYIKNGGHFGTKEGVLEAGKKINEFLSR